MSPLIFTPSLFYKFSTCPSWIWHDLFDDPSKKGETPALMEKLLEAGVLHEERYIKGLDVVEVEERRPEAAVARTLGLMREGAALIYQGAIQVEVNGVLYRGRPDLLERKAGRSLFGDYYYVPVDIKSSSEIKPEQWMQLVLYAQILEKVQGVFPEEMAIINRDQERIAFAVTAKHRAKTMAKIDEILAVMRGEKPALRLTSDCKQSPWYEQCKHEAIEANDIALLYKLQSRSHGALRENGINTVADAAKMDVGALPKIPYASAKTLARIKVQAQSLMNKEVLWTGKPKFPETSLNVYFDIEGDPLMQLQYLWGFWVVGDPEGKYAKIGQVHKPENGKYFLYFLAEQPEDEKDMWKQFLAWLELLPKEDITIWHYHHYEVDQCNALEKRYGGSEALHAFVGNFVDLAEVVQKNVVLPLYFYSIKDIAKQILKFKWRHEKAGGAQSIFWYEEWLEKGDRAILQDIINYNEDDVRATERLRDWLVTR